MLCYTFFSLKYKNHESNKPILFILYDSINDSLLSSGLFNKWIKLSKHLWSRNIFFMINKIHSFNLICLSYFCGVVVCRNNTHLGVMNWYSKWSIQLYCVTLSRLYNFTHNFIYHLSKYGICFFYVHSNKQMKILYKFDFLFHMRLIALFFQIQIQKEKTYFFNQWHSYVKVWGKNTQWEQNLSFSPLSYNEHSQMVSHLYGIWKLRTKLLDLWSAFMTKRMVWFFHNFLYHLDYYLYIIILLSILLSS